MQDSNLRPPACKGQAACCQNQSAGFKPHGYADSAKGGLPAGASSSQDFATRFVTERVTFPRPLKSHVPRDLQAALSHPDRDARAAGQVARAPLRPIVSSIEDGNPVYARLGEASPCSEAALVDSDDLPVDFPWPNSGPNARRCPGDPEKSGRDYRRATDHPPVHPHDLSRLSESRCLDRDTGRAPCRRRRRSGRGRPQEKHDAADRDRNTEPHEATLNRPCLPSPPLATPALRPDRD